LRFADEALRALVETKRKTRKPVAVAEEEPPRGASNVIDWSRH
jgi:non-homologous end joining protein Ku